TGRHSRPWRRRINGFSLVINASTRRTTGPWSEREETLRGGGTFRGTVHRTPRSVDRGRKRSDFAFVRRADPIVTKNSGVSLAGASIRGADRLTHDDAPPCPGSAAHAERLRGDQRARLPRRDPRRRSEPRRAGAHRLRRAPRRRLRG